MPRIFTFIFLFLFLPKAYAQNHQKICIKNVCLKAEIAETPAARERGLMFKDSLSEKQGMLFIFEEEEIHVFWMKNMRFPLDMIWIDAEKRIVEIKENIPPCRQTCENITPAAEAKYVLEVSSGFVKQNVIKVGDRLEF